jgi:hypothetical protein
MHFTPTSSSWINQVERFCALLTDQQLRHLNIGANSRREVAFPSDKESPATGGA